LAELAWDTLMRFELSSTVDSGLKSLAWNTEATSRRLSHSAASDLRLPDAHYIAD